MRNRPRRIFEIWKIALGCVVLGALICLALSPRCEPRVPQPPFETSFDTKQVGSRTQFLVDVTEKNEYAINIDFVLSDPLVSALQRRENILGAPENKSGNRVETGVPAAFRVRISSAIDDGTILDKTVERPLTDQSYLGKNGDIASIVLKPGIYKVQLDYLQGAPELGAIPAMFRFVRAHHGK